MEKNNNNPSTIKVYSTLIKKIQREEHIKKTIKRISKKYFKKFSESKQFKQKVLALLGAGLILGGFDSNAVSAPSPDIYYQPQNQSFYSIALAKDNATINVDGEIIPIDKDSFIIASEYEAIALDRAGDIHKGFIKDNDFTELLQITEKEMANYVIYQVNETSGVNVMSTSAIENNNIISTVPYKDYILGYKAPSSIQGDEWISTLFIDGETIYEGFIREDLLQEVTIVENEFENYYDSSLKTPRQTMIVDTSSVENNPLNLRTAPDEFDKRTIMTTIPNGSTVQIIGETLISGNREWCQINYTSDDGCTFEGWVATEYLAPCPNINQELTEANISKEPTDHVEENEAPELSAPIVIDESQINASGNITGIDISGISPDYLRELLQSGIPASVSSANYENNIDSSQVAGDINFVYIKLGASPYGSGKFEPTDYNNYIEQVKVCEELGVPYGFYYYSTSITVEEAKIELEHIKEKIENLRQHIDLDNNKLEIVIDIELASNDSYDRQRNGNIEKQTEAKAFLINGIQKEGLSDNVLIYGPIRVMRPDLDRVINLSTLHSLLSNPDNVALWMCSPSSIAGHLSNDVQKNISYAKEQGFDTVVHQVVLDSKVIGLIDINNMDLEHFQKLLNYEKSQNTSAHSNEAQSSMSSR